jgi:hypothetical protein
MVYYNFRRGEKVISILLYKVLHYYLSRVIRYKNTSVFIFFPYIFYPEKETNFPGKSNSKAYSLL